MLKNNSSLIKTGVMAMLLSSGAALAGIHVQAEEVNGDVVFTGGGSLDLSSMQFFGLFPQASLQNVIEHEQIFFGESERPDLWRGGTAGDTGPSVISIFTDRNFMPTESSGDQFGIAIDILGQDNFMFFVPEGYVSGEILNARNVYANQTIASLGLIEDEYTWTWNTASGGTDFFTISTVPTPGSIGVLGFFGLMGARRRRAC